ncbi:MAG: S-methyl-5'-thioadenosine phosphorylase [Acidobacteria bacterium]|nr:S-methyl-5'-thioadenosine phosphorylase [Acidobacteriota bacterium]
MTPRAEIGVFGGSGLYAFIEGAAEHRVATPYGETSAPVVIGEVAGRRVAFLPRHGARHEFPPHRVPYLANIWAMKDLGVTRVLAPTAAGSLQPRVRRGDFVICDQLVDRTSGRAATFYDGPGATHVSLADPYCPELRRVAIERGKAAGLPLHESGTVVVVEGPRFSTRAESRWFASSGWEVINMTQHPEAALARELELCYANISVITDYDAGVETTAPVSVDEVIEAFGASIHLLRDLLLAVVPAIPVERACPCASALRGARVGH